MHIFRFDTYLRKSVCEKKCVARGCVQDHSQTQRRTIMCYKCKQTHVWSHARGLQGHVVVCGPRPSQVGRSLAGRIMVSGCGPNKYGAPTRSESAQSWNPWPRRLRGCLCASFILMFGGKLEPKLEPLSQSPTVSVPTGTYLFQLCSSFPPIPEQDWPKLGTAVTHFPVRPLR